MFYWILYFVSISLAVNYTSWALLLSAVFFLIAQRRTQVSFVPGLETVQKANIEILKTMRYLNKVDHYE